MEQTIKQVQESIYETIKTLASEPIQSDRTVLCEVIKTVHNKNNNTYTYWLSPGTNQNSFSIANVEKEYEMGTKLYVLIPEGNFNNDKFIQGIASTEDEKPKERGNDYRKKYLQITDNISISEEKVLNSATNFIEVAKFDNLQFNYNLPKKYRYLAMDAIFQSEDFETNIGPEYQLIFQITDKNNTDVFAVMSSNSIFGFPHWDEPTPHFALFEFDNFNLEDIREISVSFGLVDLNKNLDSGQSITLKSLSLSVGNNQEDYSSSALGIYHVDQNPNANLEDLDYSDFNGDCIAHRFIYWSEEEKKYKATSIKVDDAIVVTDTDIGQTIEVINDKTENEEQILVIDDDNTQTLYTPKLEWFRYRVGSYNVGVGNYWEKIGWSKQESEQIVSYNYDVSTFPLNTNYFYKGIVNINNGIPQPDEILKTLPNEKETHESFKLKYTDKYGKSVISNTLRYEAGYKDGYVEITSDNGTVFTKDGEGNWNPSKITLRANTEEKIDWYINNTIIKENSDFIQIDEDKNELTIKSGYFDEYDTSSSINVKCVPKNSGILGDNIDIFGLKNGQDGQSAKDFTVTADSYVLKKKVDGSGYEKNVILTAHLVNLSGEVKWKKGQDIFGDRQKQQVITEPGTYTAVLLNGETETEWTDSVTITAISDGAKGDEGAAAISIVLTNPNMVFHAQGDSEDSETCEVYVYEGTKQLNYDSSLSNGTFKITNSTTGNVMNNNTIVINKQTSDGSQEYKLEIISFNGTASPEQTFTIFWKVVSDGNGINTIKYEYITTTDQIPPGEGDNWQDNIPELSSEKKYLWQKETMSFTKGIPKTTILLLAVYGDSISISDTSIEYAVSGSGTQYPENEEKWNDDIPELTDEEPYLWTRTTVEYSDNTKTTAYSVAYNGKDGTSPQIAVLEGDTNVIVKVDKEGKIIGEKGSQFTALALGYTYTLYSGINKQNSRYKKQSDEKWSEEINTSHNFWVYVGPTLTDQITYHYQIAAAANNGEVTGPIYTNTITITPIKDGEQGPQGDPGKDANPLIFTLEDNGFNGRYNLYGNDNRAISKRMIEEEKTLTANFADDGENYYNITSIIWKIPINATMLTIKEKAPEEEISQYERLWWQKDNIENPQYYELKYKSKGQKYLSFDKCNCPFYIKNKYSSVFTNNKIICEVITDGDDENIKKDWKGSFDLYFSSGGNQGTDYSFSIDFVPGYPSVLESKMIKNEKEEINVETGDPVQVCIKDTEGNIKFSTLYVGIENENGSFELYRWPEDTNSITKANLEGKYLFRDLYCAHPITAKDLNLNEKYEGSSNIIKFDEQQYGLSFQNDDYETQHFPITLLNIKPFITKAPSNHWWTIVQGDLYDSEGKNISDKIVDELKWKFVQSYRTPEDYIEPYGMQIVTKENYEVWKEQFIDENENFPPELLVNQILIYSYCCNGLDGNILQADVSFPITRQTASDIGGEINTAGTNINYRTQLAIPTRSTDKRASYAQIPDYIAYNGSGSNPSYSDVELKVYDENGEPFECYWRMVQSNASGGYFNYHTINTETEDWEKKEPIQIKIKGVDGYYLKDNNNNPEEIKQLKTIPSSNTAYYVIDDSNNYYKIDENYYILYKNFQLYTTTTEPNSNEQNIELTFWSHAVMFVNPKYTTYKFHPSPQYSEDKEILKVVATDPQGGGFWCQPIVITRDAYEFTMLNEWGGKVKINEKTGTILSSLIGAGKKNSQNAFTGVLMGTIGDAEGNPSFGSTGIYGLKDGMGTFGLQENGSFFFGNEVDNQIKFDTNGNGLSIKTNKMLLNIQKNWEIGNQTYQTIFYLDTDALNSASKRYVMRFCNTRENESDMFALWSDGTANIAGWQLTDRELIADGGTVGMSSIGSHYAFWAGGNKVVNDNSPPKFAVKHNGTLYATGAVIEGNITCNTLTANTSGTIAGWTIEGNRIYKGNTELSSASGAARIKTDSIDITGGSISVKNVFKMSSDGTIEITNSKGYFTFGPSAKCGNVGHPYVSGLNVSKSGVAIKNTENITDNIQTLSNALYLSSDDYGNGSISAESNLNISSTKNAAFDSGGYLRINANNSSMDTPSDPWSSWKGDNSLYLTAGNNINLRAMGDIYIAPYGRDLLIGTLKTENNKISFQYYAGYTGYISNVGYFKHGIYIGTSNSPVQ